MLNPSRLAQLSSLFGTVNLGDWSNDQEVSIWLAMRILPAVELQAKLAGAVLHVAQGKAIQDKAAGETYNRITAEIVDDFCGTPPHHGWPHVLQQLGELAERYPAGSMLRNAAFDLSQRIVSRAAELGKR
jgi:hypothetical protein